MLSVTTKSSKSIYEFPCTECGGDAIIGYCCGKSKNDNWGGLVKNGERLCLSCGKKRGIDFFGKVKP